MRSYENAGTTYREPTELNLGEVLPVRSPEDIIWSQLGPEDASAVREALTIAGLLRELDRPNEARTHLAQTAIDLVARHDT